MLTVDESKILVMACLGIGTFIIGIIPAWFSPSSRQRCPLLLSAMLCFGGGVLLATAIIHMLPEVREELPEYAEIIFCGGFFLVYLVDELVHYFWGETINHSHGGSESRHIHHHSPQPQRQSTGFRSTYHPTYGTTETAPLLNGVGHDDYSRQSAFNPAMMPTGDSVHVHGNPQVVLTPASSNCCEEESSNARICHVNHTEPCNNNKATGIGLLMALSLHAILEGLAVGLQPSAPKVLLLFAAVASHKFVVGFCLGVELSANARNKISRTIISILIFSLGSVIGIGIGMKISDLEQEWTKIALPVLQALAGGTLLYVTVCEVLPRERSRWHSKPSNKSAGLLQFVSVAVGFTVMTLLNIYLGKCTTREPCDNISLTDISIASDGFDYLYLVIGGFVFLLIVLIYRY